MLHLRIIAGPRPGRRGCCGSIGLAAAILLFLLRLVQGLCLGGEYGGAIAYVAEHVSDVKRGFYTGWLQTSPTLGAYSIAVPAAAFLVALFLMPETRRIKIWSA